MCDIFLEIVYRDSQDGFEGLSKRRREREYTYAPQPY